VAVLENLWLPNIIRVITSRRVRWAAGHVAHMKKMRNAHIFMKIMKGRNCLGDLPTGG